MYDSDPCFDDLATDNGPDLFVYLSTAPADGSTPFETELSTLVI